MHFIWREILQAVEWHSANGDRQIRNTSPKNKTPKPTTKKTNPTTFINVLNIIQDICDTLIITIVLNKIMIVVAASKLKWHILH